VAVTEQRMTLEEFLKLPEREPALEFIDGEVTQKVSAKGKHSWPQTDWVELINRFARPRKLARAFSELRMRFGGFSRVPDVSVYLWDRIPRDASGRVADDFRDPPDIAIEIISPGQSVNSLIRRCLHSVRNGVKIILLVDPEDESITDFRSEGPPKVLQGEDQLAPTSVLPDFRLTVRELFDSLYDR
jgi:Uma2 family endonuclease